MLSGGKKLNRINQELFCTTYAKVKQVALNVARMDIDILFKVLATEWLSLVLCESVMADHLLGPQN